MNEIIDGRGVVLIEDRSHEEEIANSDGKPLVVSISTDIVALATGVTTTGLQTKTQANVNFQAGFRLNVWGTATSFDVQVQGLMFDGIWRTLTPSDFLTGGSLVPDITVAGIYDFDVAGFQTIALNVVSVTGGNVNAKGTLLP